MNSQTEQSQTEQPAPVAPFEDQGQHTIIHNAVIDVLLPRLSGDAIKVLFVLMRKGTPQSRMLLHAGTGILTRADMQNALEELGIENLLHIDDADLISLNLNFEVAAECSEEDLWA